MRLCGGVLLVLSCLLLPLAASRAAVFTVDTIEDAADASPADGRCADQLARCSLRAAIEQANASAGADRIQFAIPSPLPHAIAIGVAPAILGTLTIDGTTQPGSTVNTSATGTNAVWGVKLRGVGAGALSLEIDAPSVEIRGLELECAPISTPCILFGPQSNGSRFRGNRVARSGGVGVRVESSRVRIGDPARAYRNLIHDNVDGVRVTGDGNFVVNNVIGADAAGGVPLGNVGAGVVLEGDANTLTDNLIAANGIGVEIQGDRNQLLRNRLGGDQDVNLGNSQALRITGSDNQIGLYQDSQLTQGNEIFGNVNGIQIASPAAGNRIAGNRIGAIFRFNAGAGVEILGSSGNHVENNEISYNFVGVKVLEIPTGPTTPPIRALGNDIESNRFWVNTQASIQLGNSGSPHNDSLPGLPPDFDEGPNRLQNTPLITSASIVQNSTSFGGYIDAKAGRYRIDFYSNPFCRFAERAGEFFVASTFIDTTGTASQPRTTFSVDFPVTAQGQGFTATATDADGNTSELGNCFSAASAGGSDIVLDATLSASTLNPGDPVRLSLSVENRGPFLATNVPVVVALPAGFFSAWTPVAGFDPATATWILPALDPNEVRTLDLEATVLSSAAGRLALNFAAENGLSQYDPNLTNNRGSLSAFVRSGADLVVSQSAPLSGRDGQRVRIGVSVANAGPQDAVGVSLNGTLDPGLVFEGSDALPGRFGYTPATRRWTWLAGNLPDGSTAAFNLEAHVDATLAPDTGLQHVVSAFAASPSDPLPNLSTVVVGLGATADLAASIQKGGEFEPFRDWTLTATALGPEPVSRFRWRIECNAGVRLYVSEESIPTISSTPTCPTTLAEAIGCPLVCEGGFEAGRDYGQLYVLWQPTSAIATSLTAKIEMDSASPHYDPTPANDSATWLPDYGGLQFLPICGLIGIEGPIFLGFVAWLRSRARRRREARVGTQAKAASTGAAGAVVIALAAVAAITVSAPAARATQVAFTIDSASSRASVEVESSLGAPSPVDTIPTGGIDAEVTLGSDAALGVFAQSLQLTGSTIALSSFEIVLASPFLYDLHFVGAGLVARLDGPASDAFPVAPGLAFVNLIGSAIRFDEGTIRATGVSFGRSVDTQIDLATTPLRSPFDGQTIAEIRTLERIGEVVTLQLTLPVAATIQLILEDEPFTVSFRGTVVAHARAVVPEPTAAALLGLGLASLASRRRATSTAWKDRPQRRSRPALHGHSVIETPADPNEGHPT